MAEDALLLLCDVLRNDLESSYKHSQLCYYSHLGIYSNGGVEIPPPPKMDGLFDEDDDFVAAR